MQVHVAARRDAVAERVGAIEGIGEGVAHLLHADEHPGIEELEDAHYDARLPVRAHREEEGVGN